MRKRILKLALVLLSLCVLFSGCMFLPGESQPGLVAKGYSEHYHLKYTRPDPQQFQTQLQLLQERLESGRTVVYVVNGIYEINELYDSYYSSMTVAQLNYWNDMTDTYWQEEYDFCTENLVVAEQAMEEMYRMLAASPYRQELESDSYYGKDYFLAYDGESYWDETYTDIVQRQQQLLTDYYALSAQQPDDLQTHSRDLAQILVELIRVRQEEAAYLGYISYPEYIYWNRFGRSYTPEQAQTYYTWVAEDLREPYIAACASGKWDLFYETCEPRQTYEYVASAAQTMGGAIGEAFSFLQERTLYNLRYDENKYPASMETYLYDIDAPFIYVYPSRVRYDQFVFAHEFGHFVNDYMCYGYSAGVDVSEVHSTAMEWMTMLYSPQDGQLEELMLLDALCNHVEQSAYADFEHQIYALQADALNVDTLAKLYRTTCEKYGLAMAEGDEWYFTQTPHFYMDPMYITSYVFSSDVALQLYQLEKQHSGKGLEVFNRMLSSDHWDLLAFCQEFEMDSPFALKRQQKLLALFTQ